MSQSLDVGAKHLKYCLLLAGVFIYIGLELSLNFSLIDIYSQPLEEVFTQHADAVGRLDLYARGLSALALALFIIPFIPLPGALSVEQVKYSETEPNNRGSFSSIWRGVFSTRLLPKAFIFVAIWLALVPVLRLVIDGFIDSQASAEARLSSVRAVIFKEGYAAGAIEIENGQSFNTLAEDETRSNLIIATIPSLAYLSPSFNRLIEQNLDNMAASYMKGAQEADFDKYGLPRLEAFDELYEQEWQQYKQAKREYLSASAKVKDNTAIANEVREHLSAINSWLVGYWNHYRTMSSEKHQDVYAGLANLPNIQASHKAFKAQFDASDCDAACKEKVKIAQADALNNFKFSSGDGLEIFVKPEHIDFEDTWGFYNVTARLEEIFRKGRQAWLDDTYGFAGFDTVDEFRATDKFRKRAILVLKERGIELPPDWQLNQTRILAEKVKQQSQVEAQAAAKAVWLEYISASKLKIEATTLDRIDFANHPAIVSVERDMLGEFYVEGSSLALSRDDYKNAWLKQQDNISFIRLITSTAAVAAFSPGGALYEMGEDAFRLAIILPAIIALSVFTILAMCGRVVGYFFRRNWYYCTVSGVVFILLLLAPAILNDDRIYRSSMSEFAKNLPKENKLEQALYPLYGDFLDYNLSLINHYHDLAFFSDVRLGEATPGKYQQSAVFGGQVVSAIEKFDNWAVERLSWVPDLLLSPEQNHYDLHIALLRRDKSIGVYMGVELDGNKVTGVKLPNFLADSDLGVLLEQRFFYQPDRVQLAMKFAKDYNDENVLFDIASGKFGKENAIAKIERRLIKLFNQRPLLLTAMLRTQEIGHKNLFLIQTSADEDYHCFSAPTIDVSSISEIIAQKNIVNNKIENCRMAI